MTSSNMQGRRGPTFNVIEGPPPSFATFLLAFLASACILVAITIGLRHSKASARANVGSRLSRSAGRLPDSKTDADDDDKDDPSQIDTVYLGDAADAPVPSAHSGHASHVHATVIVRLPRFGPQMGLIPNTDAGHLLYRWLAAFNQANSIALEQALPNSPNAASTVAAELRLRQQTGGFRLLSANEIQPGLLVFRLEDQTPANNEALGTLQLVPSSDPPSIDSLSVRAINQP